MSKNCLFKCYFNFNHAELLQRFNTFKPTLSHTHTRARTQRERESTYMHKKTIWSPNVERSRITQRHFPASQVRFFWIAWIVQQFARDSSLSLSFGGRWDKSVESLLRRIRKTGILGVEPDWIALRLMGNVKAAPVTWV